MKIKFKQLWSIIPPILTKVTTTFQVKSWNTKKDYYIWHWKSRSWLGTGTSVWQAKPILPL